MFHYQRFEGYGRNVRREVKEKGKGIHKGIVKRILIGR